MDATIMTLEENIFSVQTTDDVAHRESRLFLDYINFFFWSYKNSSKSQKVE